VRPGSSPARFNAVSDSLFAILILLSSSEAQLRTLAAAKWLAIPWIPGAVRSICAIKPITAATFISTEFVAGN
jgi:hypothetical protein